MKSVEATGKNIDEAIKAGLIELGGLSVDDVDVEIICSGGWLKKAKVRLTVSEDDSLESLKESVKQGIATEKQPETKKYTAPVVKKSEEKQPAPEHKKEERKPRPEKSVKVEEKTEDQEIAPEQAEPIEEIPVKPVSPEQAELARVYVTELLSKMGIEAAIVINTDRGAIDVDIVTDDTTVIGHHGEVLDSIQILAKRAVEEGEDKRLAVHVDCKGYRQQREKTLVAMANRMAAKAIKTGRKVVLEPMNNTQRKVIHATLNDNGKVFTKSEGHEPNRRVVIIPKRSRRHSYNHNKPENTGEANE